jgi:hypothetical protein
MYLLEQEEQKLETPQQYLPQHPASLHDAPPLHPDERCGTRSCVLHPLFLIHAHFSLLALVTVFYRHPKD